MPKKSNKHIAIYVRVSSDKQKHASQLPDLEQSAESQDGPVVWYKDKASGKTMDRPGWNKLEDAMRRGKVSKIVAWRLDRLGRTTIGLATLFKECRERKIALVCLRDGLDLTTPAGRHFARMIASQAEYEREIISERVKAGQAVARANGKKWGGSKPGSRKVTAEKRESIKHLLEQGTPKAAIARAVGLSRPTVYEVIRQLNKEASSEA